jgi:hypothetical protein
MIRNYELNTIRIERDILAETAHLLCTMRKGGSGFVLDREYIFVESLAFWISNGMLIPVTQSV